MSAANLKVLAIETSCDETGVAVVEGPVAAFPAKGTPSSTDRNRLTGFGPVRIVANGLYSQIELHRRFGGIYPEAASREQIAKIGPILEKVLSQVTHLGLHTKCAKRCANGRDYIRDEIDAIAVTAGPGLIGSLLVGVNVAKTLAYVFDKPLIGVNHHEGHVMAAWIDPSSENPKSEAPNPKQIQNTKSKIPKLPAVALVVSGGHTMLVLMKDYCIFKILGRTRDDAAGEAFDKVARLLGLPYPGGPQISKLAAAHELRIKNYELWEPNKSAHDSRFVIQDSIRLPRPMLNSGDLDFSFSGIKTAVARLVAQHEPLTDELKSAIAHEFQEAVVQVLVAKTAAAVERYQPRSVIVCGGVAANRRLREAMADCLSRIAYRASLHPRTEGRSSEAVLPVSFHIPSPALCTDNAAMIGAAALARAAANRYDSWETVVADDQLTLAKYRQLPRRLGNTRLGEWRRVRTI